MSLKSFDKFCENLILAEPCSKRDKEVFDERQKQIRSKLGIEAMTICLISIFINAMFWEIFVRWSENQFAANLLIGMLCALYFLIRCAAKGCLATIGDNKIVQKGTLIVTSVVCTLNLIRNLFTTIDDGILTEDGVFSDEFIFTLTFLIGIISSVFSLCVIRHTEKSTESEESK